LVDEFVDFSSVGFRPRLTRILFPVHNSSGDLDDRPSLSWRDRPRSQPPFLRRGSATAWSVRILDFDGRGSDYGAMAAPFGVEFTITVEASVSPPMGMHICFRAPSCDAVRAFHESALKTGGRDDGVPDLHPPYHANYYGAFVLDPDGHRLEAVCNVPEK